ncbi:MAG: septation protein A [Gammaproteobacteria bacterium]|nr:septation protein A [Gammaproteobacteria bacterium]MDH3370163.1 septation protein A [Gammaproteobacteria bacterium]MDH3406299.1 septation protein A [Gammaproteobacteria bacterium]MDH3562102.1 septation protein A [Gammaproteobacteria bacterium]MDH5486093.1 septation protein A [Gammaproteobacteria bacterium]
MKFLYDLFPLLLFFAAFKLYDIYIATAVAIVASFLQVGLFWVKHRRFETMHMVTLGVIAVFGGMTLLLHDDTFIKWKPTLVYWILSALVLASQWFGKKTVIERMMSSQIALPETIWKRLNLSWGVFFAVLGAINLYVAFYYALDLDAATRQEIWVNFKVFGLLGITLVFVVVQAFFMARHMQAKPEDGGSTANRTAD